ncbi:MAG: sugar ABC transporter substrate-binding protein [Merismopedia sp. SIO2A8]|nr:sugar ABC transporter substrate-binding protein [Merismopedia sp. SIO2A8]
MLKKWRWLTVLTALLFLALGLSGCSQQLSSPGTLQVWAHSGPEAERQIITQQVARFNGSQSGTTVDITFLPEGSYNAQIQAAAISGDLPDVLEFDGPFVYNYVWQQNLIPLDDLISPGVRDDLLPSILDQGTYGDRLYSVGTFDSGLGLYGNRQMLETAGIRIPQGNDDAWTADEFQNALVALAKTDPDGHVLDLKLNYQGEWATYGFSPMLQSAGGDLINRQNYQSARGTLDSEGAIAAMTQLQSWLQEGYVDPNIDDAAFTTGRVALSWVGHWTYPSYMDALGDDLVVLPLPNFGQGSKTGQGSWNWGITQNCATPNAAMAFLEFILQPDEVLAMSNANGAVPGTKSAIAQSSLYQDGGPLRLFSSQLLTGKSIPRPQTPAYPVITSVFQQAFADIRHGADVATVLKKAAIAIDQDIEDNEGYPIIAL